jgi:hypothetical protein
MSICKNCGKVGSDVYCSHCGQKLAVERITIGYIWHGLVHFFIHIEKGFLYTSWQMLKAPGRIAINFIGGKRKNYQTPVSYFLIWNAAYILLIYILEKSFGENKVVDFTGYFGETEKTKYALSHLNIILAALLPLQALYTYLFLMHKWYNYLEALVTIFYGIGTVLLLQFVFVSLAIPIYMLSDKSVDIRYSDILKILFIGWLVFDLAKLLPLKHKILRSVIVLILTFATFTMWRAFVYPQVAELFFK